MKVAGGLFPLIFWNRARRADTLRARELCRLKPATVQNVLNLAKHSASVNRVFKLGMTRIFLKTHIK